MTIILKISKIIVSIFVYENSLWSSLNISSIYIWHVCSAKQTVNFQLLFLDDFIVFLYHADDFLKCLVIIFLLIFVLKYPRSQSIDCVWWFQGRDHTSCCTGFGSSSRNEKFPFFLDFASCLVWSAAFSDRVHVFVALLLHPGKHLWCPLFQAPGTGQST